MAPQSLTCMLGPPYTLYYATRSRIHITTENGSGSLIHVYIPVNNSGANPKCSAVSQAGTHHSGLMDPDGLLQSTPTPTNEPTSMLIV